MENRIDTAALVRAISDLHGEIISLRAIMGPRSDSTRPADETQPRQPRVQRAAFNLVTLTLTASFLGYSILDYVSDVRNDSSKANRLGLLNTFSPMSPPGLDICFFLIISIHFVRLILCINFLDADRTLAAAKRIYYHDKGPRKEVTDAKLEFCLRVGLFSTIASFLFFLGHFSRWGLSGLLIAQIVIMGSFYKIYWRPMLKIDPERYKNFVVLFADVSISAFLILSISTWTWAHVLLVSHPHLIEYLFFCTGIPFVTLFLVEVFSQFGKDVWNSVSVVISFLRDPGLYPDSPDGSAAG